jgi:hypothetical protein
MEIDKLMEKKLDLLLMQLIFAAVDAVIYDGNKE